MKVNPIKQGAYGLRLRHNTLKLLNYSHLRGVHCRSGVDSDATVSGCRQAIQRGMVVKR